MGDKPCEFEGFLISVVRGYASISLQCRRQTAVSYIPSHKEMQHLVDLFESWRKDISFLAILFPLDTGWHGKMPDLSGTRAGKSLQHIQAVIQASCKLPPQTLWDQMCQWEEKMLCIYGRHQWENHRGGSWGLGKRLWHLEGDLYTLGETSFLLLCPGRDGVLGQGTPNHHVPVIFHTKLDSVRHNKSKNLLGAAAVHL